MKKKVGFFEEPTIGANEAEEKIVQALYGLSNAKQVAWKVVEFKKMPLLKPYLEDDKFLQRVCLMADVAKPQ